MSDGSVPINSEKSLSLGWFHNLQILKKAFNFSFSNNFLIVMAAQVIFRCKLLVFHLFNMLAMKLCLHGARLCHAEMHKSSSKLITLGIGRSVSIAGL